MEVHHHPELHHHSKPWKEYILEYIMIVLAVTTGFFAESLREHINDKSKEKEYLLSLANELKYDTAQYNVALRKIFYVKPMLDSLYYNVTNAKQFNYILSGKWNTPINETRVAYMPTMPTFQQLKSSGNLRLIENKKILAKIMEYESLIEGTLKIEVLSINAAAEKVYAFEDELCNESDFNQRTNQNMQDSAAQFNMENGAIYDMPILMRDPIKLNQFANSFINYKSRNWGYYTRVNTAKQMATELIKLIGDEYHLEE
ncbi:MAG: hypothetical protein JST87_17695 [Bacteroidetes bacterium]|nr:hypothetical protein [Bacteroidota bacterium]